MNTPTATLSAYIGNLAAGDGIDLWFEMQMAVRSTRDYGGLPVLARALGITREGIDNAGGVGVMKIRTSGRYFEPAAAHAGALGAINAETAVIVPVWEPHLGGDLVDMLAFRRDRPALFFVRTGYAKCLGGSFADDVRGRTTLWALPADVHPSLALFPNPLTWLRAECEGTVVLNLAWLVYTLEGVRAVTAFNEAHAHRLHTLMTWPGAPNIFLRQQREAA